MKKNLDWNTCKLVPLSHSSSIGGLLGYQQFWRNWTESRWHKLNENNYTVRNGLTEILWYGFIAAAQVIIRARSFQDDSAITSNASISDLRFYTYGPDTVDPHSKPIGKTTIWIRISGICTVFVICSHVGLSCSTWGTLRSGQFSRPLWWKAFSTGFFARSWSIAPLHLYLSGKNSGRHMYQVQMRKTDSLGATTHVRKSENWI